MNKKKESGHYLWYRTAGTHLWRTFFRFRANGREPDTPAKQYSFSLCRMALAEHPKFEQQFLEMYFTTCWGTDSMFLSGYASENGISESLLWRIVFDANRRLFELAGLIDPK